MKKKYHIQVIYNRRGDLKTEGTHLTFIANSDTYSSFWRVNSACYLSGDMSQCFTKHLPFEDSHAGRSLVLCEDIYRRQKTNKPFPRQLLSAIVMSYGIKI